ncbi:MAG TPA: VTT domain-containing protein [Anaerolineales bacterium]|nr:VTT domain-containing protein [Anaerolineales bacterium]
MSNNSIFKSTWFLIGIRVISLLVVIAITIYIFSIRDKAQQLAIYGYPGIFVLAFLAYATVFLPAPGVAVIFTMGAVFNPLVVALVAGAGASLGELTGYLAGFSSQPMVERIKIYQRMVDWIKKYGAFAILVLSAIPNPFFDVTGAAAGALKMPVPKFLLCTWVGETLKMLVFAYAGASSLKSIFG